MKKTVSLLIALLLCLSLCACGGNKVPEKMTPKEAIIDAAEWKVQFQLTASGCKGLPNAQVTSIEEVSENEFEFCGTFSAQNEFNQTVKGTFEGTGTYNTETEKASVSVELN